MLDILLPKPKPVPAAGKHPGTAETGIGLIQQDPAADATSSTREKLRGMLRAGKLDNRYVDVDITEKNMPMVEIFSNAGMEEMGINFKDMLGGLMPRNTKRRKVKVPEALEKHGPGRSPEPGGHGQGGQTGHPEGRASRASFFSMKSTKLPAVTAAPVRMCPGRAYSATFCRLWKVPV